MNNRKLICHKNIVYSLTTVYSRTHAHRVYMCNTHNALTLPELWYWPLLSLRFLDKFRHVLRKQHNVAGSEMETYTFNKYSTVSPLISNICVICFTV